MARIPVKGENGRGILVLFHAEGLKKNGDRPQENISHFSGCRIKIRRLTFMIVCENSQKKASVKPSHQQAPLWNWSHSIQNLHMLLITSAISINVLKFYFSL